MSSRVVFYKTLPHVNANGDRETLYAATLGCARCESSHVVSGQSVSIFGAEATLLASATRDGWLAEYDGPSVLLREDIAADGVRGVCPPCRDEEGV